MTIDDTKTAQVPDVDPQVRLVYLETKMLEEVGTIRKLVNRFWVVLVVWLILTVIGWVLNAV